ncbi:hypothetical protein SUGI_1025540 [Cryptomeria japonica]|uniref:uncharacterized protein LOC131029354 n=1 Tax=Cryptomeria japonica TaxID=3369 RepID=UPI00241493A7|nr:uncharacterized protein LOC131029354 [Cryptomeria japonica]GLJ48603.1 hypothetical protein SUGI_1025540 [Cryptomeria japonica]
MSVYGGDSWAPEAYCRKRRIDLLLSNQLDESHSHKLPNGKYVCLVCSNRPVLDTVSMLTMHNQGARHQAAASKLKEKEVSKQEEITKRIALSETSTTYNNTLDNYSGSFKCPLIEKTRKGAADVLSNGKNASGNTLNPKFDRTLNYAKKPFFESLNVKNVNRCDQKTDSTVCHSEVNKDVNSNMTSFAQINSNVVSNVVHEQKLNIQEQRDRELKFRAAGWRRDGKGGWFREENVEFDSDEEDPNVILQTSF